MSIELFNKLEAKLKELNVDEEKIGQIVDFSKKNTPLEWRTKDDYKKLKGEFEAFEETTKEKQGLIDDLTSKAGKVDEYEQAISDYKEKLSQKDVEYKNKLEEKNFDNALDRMIAGDKDINPKARNTFKNLLDRESMKVDGDDLLGYQKQADLIKEKHDYLIVQDKFKGHGTNTTKKVNENSSDNPFKPGDTYNLTKQGKMVRQEPEKAKQLIIQAGLDPIKFGLK